MAMKTPVLKRAIPTSQLDRLEALASSGMLTKAGWWRSSEWKRAVERLLGPLYTGQPYGSTVVVSSTAATWLAVEVGLRVLERGGYAAAEAVADAPEGAELVIMQSAQAGAESGEPMPILQPRAACPFCRRLSRPDVNCPMCHGEGHVLEG